MLTDGFLEIYHLKYLHRNTIAPLDRYGQHTKNRLSGAARHAPSRTSSA